MSNSEVDSNKNDHSRKNLYSKNAEVNYCNKNLRGTRDFSAEIESATSGKRSINRYSRKSNVKRNNYTDSDKNLSSDSEIEFRDKRGAYRKKKSVKVHRRYRDLSSSTGVDSDNSSDSSIV